MGNWSYLCFVPASSATVPIDWTKVPETSKRYLLERWPRYIGDSEEIDEKLPETIGELGQMLNGSKCLGYMYPNLCTLFLDISEFGLKAPDTRHADPPLGPRFYMRSDENVSFILFIPGKRMGIMGYSRYLGNSLATDEGEQAAADSALAEGYDIGLRQGYMSWKLYGEVLVRKQVAGWQASTLGTILEEAQRAEAMLKLPLDDPALMDYVANSFRQLDRSREPQM